MNTRVLVLNASFEPINVCTVRRAVVLILKGVAHAEECSLHHWLHSSRFSMPTPSVIRLVEYIHIPFERKSLSRKNILLRDHNTCQYCGKVLAHIPFLLILDYGFCIDGARPALFAVSLPSVIQNPQSKIRNRLDGCKRNLHHTCTQRKAGQPETRALNDCKRGNPLRR